LKEQLQQQLDKLKERAEWHESEASRYSNDDSSYAQGAAQYHFERAQAVWHEYGRLKAYIETTERWGTDTTVLLGKVLR
jgi:hypothetical protein